LIYWTTPRVLPDVNVLVAAHHAAHLHHRVASDWLRGAVAAPANGQRLLLAMPVVSGFLRIVTHPKIFTVPSTPASAVDFVDWLLESTHVRLIERSEEWPSFRKLVLEKEPTANHIPDAWLAALALSTGEQFVTFDKGFRQLLPRNLLVLLTT
jgi:uncharacterized protein